MGRKRQEKPPLVPAQDKRICGTICLCQLTIVLSSVALVYLAVAVYLPSHRAFTYGIEPVPVMCQTINTSLPSSCDWTSCGEWCLTKSSGFCPQINVTTRRNGTQMTFLGCKEITRTSCPKAETQYLKEHNCNNDTQCHRLRGVFNCSLGRCANFSELFLCHGKADGPVIDTHKDSLKLHGFFECHNTKCTKFKWTPHCDRYCNNITTLRANVYLQEDNSVVTAECETGIAHTEARGADEGRDIEPTTVWKATGPILLASCHTISQNGTHIWATDCINGTLLKPSVIPQPEMNFTTFWNIVTSSNEPVDPLLRFLPNQHSLTIYNISKLFINLDGCVNTLRGECAEFYATHGNDGDNQTAQSRFTCFYKKNDSTLVISRFDLEKTWRDLMVAIFVPSTLFVISFITLVVIGHSVKVGDDAKMRCDLCPRKRQTPEEINAEVDLVMDGIIERTNAIVALETQANTPT